jgi:hypothetical protein
MEEQKILIVGGLVAMGFVTTGKYLLTLSHSGRGVFLVETWERVARDYTVVYPSNGQAIGIGPIEGEVIRVNERDERRDRIEMESLDRKYFLVGESDGVSIIPRR